MSSDINYHSANVLSRVEFIAMLCCAAGSMIEPAPFSDASADRSSADYLLWGIKAGLIQDYEDSNFSKEDSITQEEVNKILCRFHDKFGINIAGYPAPAANATRAQISDILENNLIFKKTQPLSVTGGRIVGFLSPSDQGIAVYRGIPYAAAPIGYLRWKAPQPVDTWEGIRPCVNWSASAIQSPQSPFHVWTKEFIIEDTGYSEDCLHLNIWAKNDGLNNKAVIVFIHGGGFVSGGSSCEVYSGKYLAKRGIVFVSINYRVGMLGFYASEELVAESMNGVSGNYALLDQIAALKWVQDNIVQFGGNPENVTIMGQSAGAGSVNALIQSPLAKGLFNRAVSQSFNSTTRPYRTLKETINHYHTWFGKYPLKELRAMDANELIQINNDGYFCIDGWALEEDFENALQNGNTNDTPIMIGMVAGDAMTFGRICANTSEEYKDALATAFGGYAKEVFTLYPAEESTVRSVTEQLNTDCMNVQQNRIADIRSKRLKSKTYSYYFSHVMPDENGGLRGAFHTSDVPYFLGILSNLRSKYWTRADREMATALTSYLINFAYNGNPNGDGLAEWLPDTGNYGTIFELKVPCGSRKLSTEKAALFAKLMQ